MEDPEVTRTAVTESADVVPGALPSSRTVAPLQFRDPDRYEAQGEHGRGGIGRVQRAHDKELGRSVAIKELIKRGELAEVRFLREAMITARLEHPSIVPIHEAGRWPDGTPFYVMKLVAGRSLKELLEERTSVDARIGLLHHVIAVADAVAYAHERQIIHRDLKPANVIAGDFGETVVIDWGLAKDLQSADDLPLGDGPYRTAERTDLTVAGSVLGTPLYMSPEQGRGESVDQRTDVYAIGAMLWQLCSCDPAPPADPYERERVLRKASIDRDLIAIILKALSPEPSARYRNARELAADLKAFKSGARIAARDYSFVAMLAHWIRRRRLVAGMLAIIVMVVIGSSILYVHGVAIERDRAARERDRALLAEATALLDKDPTRALEALDKIPFRTAQHALLRARAMNGAATRVIEIPDGVLRLLQRPQTSELTFVTRPGELTTVDDRGQQHVLDRDVADLITYANGGWLYVRKPVAGGQQTLASSSSPQTVALGSLISDDASRLIVANGNTYVLDKHDLYRIEATGAIRVRGDVQGIAGSDTTLLICTTGGTLEATQGDATMRGDTCASNPSVAPLVATRTAYAALLSQDKLLLVRDGKRLELPTHITGEYSLALAESGLLGVMDMAGKPAFVRAGSDQLEIGPAHTARVVSVGVDRDIVAWGFEDGVAIALDTRSGQQWRFVGHGAVVLQVVVDARLGRLFTTGPTELREWALRPDRLQRVLRLPCIAFNAARINDGKRIELDCDDGIVREWAIGTGAARALHQHDGVAYGVVSARGEGCSGGFDGRVLCGSRQLRGPGPRIRRMIKSPRQEQTIVAAEDGQISLLDGTPLYQHAAVPYALAFSADGRHLASGDSDGSVIVYDIVRRTIESKTKAHVGLVTSIAFRGDEVWTAGIDGAVKRSRLDGDPVQTINEGTNAHFLHVFADGWTAVTRDRVVVVQRAGNEIRVELDNEIERYVVSEDERYVAASTPSEIVVIDLQRRLIANLPASTRHGYLGFLTPGELTVSDASGLSTVGLASLDYVSFSSATKH